MISFFAINLAFSMAVGSPIVGLADPRPSLQIESSVLGKNARYALLAAQSAGNSGGPWISNQTIWNIHDVGDCKAILEYVSLHMSGGLTNRLDPDVGSITWRGGCSAENLIDGEGSLSIILHGRNPILLEYSGRASQGALNGTVVLRRYFVNPGNTLVPITDGQDAEIVDQFSKGCRGDIETCDRNRAAAIRAAFLRSPGIARPFLNKPTPAPLGPATMPAAPQVQNAVVISGMQQVQSYGYPAAAERLNQRGTVGVRLTISAAGRATGCTVTKSSGYAELDAGACDAFMRYLRFSPSGAGGTWSGSVRW